MRMLFHVKPRGSFGRRPCRPDGSNAARVALFRLGLPGVCAPPLPPPQASPAWTQERGSRGDKNTKFLQQIHCAAAGLSTPVSGGLASIGSGAE